MKIMRVKFCWDVCRQRYAIRYSICKQEFGPLLNPLNNTLTDNKYEMCCLLATQFNNVFTKPIQTSEIKVLVTFFLTHATTTRDDVLFLTDITLSNSIIIEAIRKFPLTQLWFATTRSVVKSVKVSVVEIAKRTN